MIAKSSLQIIDYNQLKGTSLVLIVIKFNFLCLATSIITLFILNI